MVVVLSRPSSAAAYGACVVVAVGCGGGGAIGRAGPVLPLRVAAVHPVLVSETTRWHSVHWKQCGLSHVSQLYVVIDRHTQQVLVELAALGVPRHS